MSQFKPGDLALIINSRNEENIGRVVTVRGFANKGDLIANESGYTETSRDGSLIVEGSIVTSPISFPALKCTVSKHVFRSEWLMPLKGDFQPEQQKSREVVE
ncbi:hypothetical protein [Pseudomonas fluorescens]|uniref:hypothetical protein n=1 Tax=Pseudomonas fluorescens TaxID=294 RepID=UPI00285B9511|nr:hypothetical protein [Pseudomonas fluorescens]MDR6163499.1 hypothetical protein [Pseudomonas fluorescens]